MVGSDNTVSSFEIIIADEILRRQILASMSYLNEFVLISLTLRKHQDYVNFMVDSLTAPPNAQGGGFIISQIPFRQIPQLKN
jgi:hypothetical protein